MDPTAEREAGRAVEPAVSRSVGRPLDTDRSGAVADLLARMEAGDRSAFDSLFPLVYQELKVIARRQRRGWSEQRTLGTTALVHEAYLKLVEQEHLAYTSESHFLAVASRAMRQILVDYARYKRRAKRGGAAKPVPVEQVEEILGVSPWGSVEEDAILEVGESLERLQLESDRHCRIVECRFFGGLNVKETAAALHISPATVKRAWAVARAWLHNDLLRSHAG
jgi:RNA polymerase sigma factor (TIGR02999 family)